MNHDPNPSFAARQRLQSDDDDDEQHTSDAFDDTRSTTHSEHVQRDGDAGPSEVADVAPPSEPSRRHKRKEGLAKKLEFVGHLQKSLDMVVFAYMCTVYYMECSLPRLLLRIFPHYIFISPKEGLIQTLPAHRPHVFAILAPNLICILIHLLFSLPHAGEATRGYLHGGAIIDFVGQKPPTYKSGLIFLDLVILALQCLMLAVHQDKERLRKAVLPSLRTMAEAAETTETEGTTQDHDAEERGVLRDEQYASENEEDSVELQPLNDGRREGIGVGHSQVSGNTSLADIMVSGNGVLGNFHVVHAVRTVGNDYSRAAAFSLQSLGYTASFAAAVAADRRATLTARRPRQ